MGSMPGTILFWSLESSLSFNFCQIRHWQERGNQSEGVYRVRLVNNLLWRVRNKLIAELKCSFIRDQVPRIGENRTFLRWQNQKTLKTHYTQVLNIPKKFTSMGWWRMNSVGGGKVVAAITYNLASSLSSFLLSTLFSFYCSGNALTILNWQGDRQLFIVWHVVSFDRIWRFGGTKYNIYSLFLWFYLTTPLTLWLLDPFIPLWFSMSGLPLPPPP